jgi:hypothetical protein
MATKERAMEKVSNALKINGSLPFGVGWGNPA